MTMVMGWIETRQSGCGHYALGTASIEALEREHDERKRSNENPAQDSSFFAQAERDRK